MKTILYPLLAICATSVSSALPYADFEDLAFTAGNYENGSNLTGSESTQNLYGTDVTVRDSTFTSGSASLSNEYVVDWFSWSQWAYSKDTDTVPNSYMNQYSSITGTGAGGSSNYALGYFIGESLSVTFASAVDFTGLGMEIANTVYAADSMLNDSVADGDFADAFTTGDYFRVVVEGFLAGSSTGSVVQYLADFTSANSADHYVSAVWNFLDLNDLGIVDELQFTLESTDAGTPSYIVIDNIGVVPEPSAYALIAGLFTLAAVSSRRRRQ